MDRINHATAVEIAPGKKGFRGREAMIGATGTRVTSKWLNDVQEELCSLVESAEALNPNRRIQLLRAVRAQRMNWVGIFGGSANALVASLGSDALAPASWDELVGVPIRGIISVSNTGPATLAIGDLPPVAIKTGDGSALGLGAMPASAIAVLTYDGAVAQLVAIGASSSSVLTAAARLAFASNVEAHLTPGPFSHVVPADVWRINVLLWGGGAGGGYGWANGCGGSGGGAGGFAQGAFNVTPGQVINGTVGAGGAGGASGAAGGNGGSSSLASLISATGGVGGDPATSTLAGQATINFGGIGSGGVIQFRGGQGGGGAGQGGAQSALGGGGGSAPMGGAGGPPRNGTGLAGQAPGGGGGGGGGANGSGANGAAGAPGAVMIFWGDVS